MGSKNRYAKELLPIILKDRNLYQWYVEPFVGGGNMIDKVSGNKRIGNDINTYVIALLNAIRDAMPFPKNVSEKEYNNVKANKDSFDAHIVGFVGFLCSYSGKWFGGYARGNDKNGKQRNYCEEAWRNITNQSCGLRGAIFTSGHYITMDIPVNSIIYCDPPYRNTTKYKDKFNHIEFWEWCDKMVKDGHSVFVSEYNAPNGWNCVWEKTVNSSLTKETGSKRATEKLFTK